MIFKVNDEVAWNCGDRYPFFDIGPGTGIVIEVADNLVRVLPHSVTQRREIYEEFGQHERQGGGMTAYSLDFNDDLLEDLYHRKE